MNPNQNSQPPLQHPEEPLNRLEAPEPTPRPQPAVTPDIPPRVAPLAPEVVATPPPVAAAPSYAHPIADTPKKVYHPKRFLIALGAFVGVSVLAVAAMLLFALLPAEKPTKTVTPAKPIATEKTISAKTAIDHVKEYFKGADVAKSPVTLPVVATGKAYYTVVPDTAPLLSVAGEVAPGASDEQLTSIIHSLEGDDFTQRISSNGAGGTNYLADFSRKETFCEVSVTKPADAKANHWFEVRCLDMATYVDYATAQDVLLSLYTPITATSVQYGFVGKPAPQAAKTSGYKTAELEVSIVVDNRMTSSGKFALFYQSADGVWHYFRDRDAAQAFDCAEYNTDGLKYAYLGTSCRNTTKDIMATVEPPKKR